MATRTATRLPREARWLAGLVAVELLAVGAYLALTPTIVDSPRYVLYPLVWIAAAAWAVLRTDPPAASRRARDGARVVAGGYFLLLAFLSGLLAVYLSPAGAAHSHSHVHGLRVTMATPGWGPRISYVTHLFHVYFVPFRVIGYLGLAYLVYAATLDAFRAAVPGVVGVATCVGCAFPLVASLAAEVGGAALAGAAATYSLDVSTVAFLLALGLLYWRPAPGLDGATSQGES